MGWRCCASAKISGYSARPVNPASANWMNGDQNHTRRAICSQHKNNHPVYYAARRPMRRRSTCLCRASRSSMGSLTAMYYNDHDPPHFRAEYGEHTANIDIRRQFVLEGSLPNAALRFVIQWARLHERELDTNWLSARRRKPLQTIAPLPRRKVARCQPLCDA